MRGYSVFRTASGPDLFAECWVDDNGSSKVDWLAIQRAPVQLSTATDLLRWAHSNAGSKLERFELGRISLQSSARGHPTRDIGIPGVSRRSGNG